MFKNVFLFTILPVLILSNNLLGSTAYNKLNNQLILPASLTPDVNKNKEASQPFKRTGPTIQLAILLDTSGSMDGLIDQVKIELWNIINDLSAANKNNSSVTIQVSLFEYGKSDISKNEGFVRMLVPLTNDLDKLSETLFSLRTNGGSEYAGRVILESVNRLTWSYHPDDLRLIVIAGNESFDQGQTNFEYAIKKAISKNIIVNTVFCGNYEKGKMLRWKDGATFGNGKYMNINHNDIVADYPSPYDEEINKLGSQLNDTYIATNRTNILQKRRQGIQDSNFAKISNSKLVERNIAKASKSYHTDWDIVSMAEEKGFYIAAQKLKSSGIGDYSSKSNEEVEKELVSKLSDRVAIKNKISELKKLRAEYIQKEKDKVQVNPKDFASVLLKNIKIIVLNNGFKFE